MPELRQLQSTASFIPNPTFRLAADRKCMYRANAARRSAKRPEVACLAGGIDRQAGQVIHRDASARRPFGKLRCAPQEGPKCRRPRA